jgi:hypothetical protein
MQCEDITVKCDSALQEKSNEIYQTIKGNYTSENWNSKNENSFEASLKSNSHIDNQIEGKQS